MTAVPLDGRSYTDLLSLQPGVAPATSLTSDTQQDVGVSALAPSGQLNPGTISINGQREFANAFIVNGKRHGGRRQLGDGDHSKSRPFIAEFRFLLANVNAGVWRIQRGPNQRCHQVRNQRISMVTRSNLSGTPDLDALKFPFLRRAGIFQQTSLAARSAECPSCARRYSSSPITKEHAYRGRFHGEKSIAAPLRARPSWQSVRRHETNPDRSRQRTILGESAFHKSSDTPLRPANPITPCIAPAQPSASLSKRYDSDERVVRTWPKSCRNTYRQMQEPTRFRLQHKTKFSATTREPACRLRKPLGPSHFALLFHRSILPGQLCPWHKKRRERARLQRSQHRPCSIVQFW